jgi:hypothetical protein
MASVVWVDIDCVQDNVDKENGVSALGIISEELNPFLGKQLHMPLQLS